VISNMDNKKMQQEQKNMLLEIDRICSKYDINYSLAYGTLLGAVRHNGYIPWDTDTDIIISADDYKILCNKLVKHMDKKYVVHSIDYDDSYEFLMPRIGLSNVPHKWMHLDIFPMVGVPDNKVMQKLFIVIAYLIKKGYFIKKVNTKINYKNQPRKKWIANLAKVVLLPIPTKFFYNSFQKMKTKYPMKHSETICNICGSYGRRELLPKSYLEDQIKQEFEGSCFPTPKAWDDYLTQMYGDYMTPRK